MARPVRAATVAKPAKSPAKPAVAKVKKPAAAAAAKKVRSHPTYFEMIAEAIGALKDRTGSSAIAIAKHVEDKQGKNLPDNFKKLLSVQLKKCLASGKLTKVKNSYKLAAPVKPAAAEKKPVKKPAAAKPVEKKEKATLKRKRASPAVDAPEKKKKKVTATVAKKAAVAAKKSPARKVAKPKTKSIKSPAGKKMKK